jgi:hypothetical protein
LLEPHLQIVPIREGEFLHLPGDEIEQVYFLHKGIVSLVVISNDGDAIATASVGSEGAIGTIAGTGFVRAFTRAMVQAPGVASQIAVSHFRRAVSKSEAINDLLTRYHMALMCQVQDARALFGCHRNRPLMHLGSAGLLWAINGGRLIELHRDWATIELAVDGSRRVFHRRRLDGANITLPWIGLRQRFGNQTHE